MMGEGSMRGRAADQDEESQAEPGPEEDVKDPVGLAISVSVREETGRV